MRLACSKCDFTTNSSGTTKAATIKCPRCFATIDLLSQGFTLDTSPVEVEPSTFPGWPCADCHKLTHSISTVGCADGIRRDLCDACARKRLDAMGL